MRLEAPHRPDPVSLLDSFLPLLGSETWDDLVVGLLRATRSWLGAQEVRFWQVDAAAGGWRSRWSLDSHGVHEDSVGRVRPFQPLAVDEGAPAPSALVTGRDGWTLDVSCCSRGGELGFLEVRGSGDPPDGGLVSQWPELAGNALMRGREALRERLQAGGIRRLPLVARELSTLGDPDVFWKRVVEHARDTFGMERCSVLLPGPDPSELRGAWGTDFDGRTVDEHGTIHAVPILEARASRLLGQVRSWVALAEDLPRCGAGSSLTVGSVPVSSVLTPVPGLPEGPCWLLTDRAITGGGVEPALQDLLEAYALVVGQIAGRQRAEQGLDGALEAGEAPRRLADLLDVWEPPAGSRGGILPEGGYRDA